MHSRGVIIEMRKPHNYRRNFKRSYNRAHFLNCKAQDGEGWEVIHQTYDVSQEGRTFHPYMLSLKYMIQHCYRLILICMQHAERLIRSQPPDALLTFRGV
jgi:hypothetical protein